MKMENSTCGLTRAELDAHGVGISELCPALKRDKTQCNCPYAAHQPVQLGNASPSREIHCVIPSHILRICILFAFDEFN
jgi:hypothetical protein